MTDKTKQEVERSFPHMDIYIHDNPDSHYYSIPEGFFLTTFQIPQAFTTNAPEPVYTPYTFWGPIYSNN